MAFLAGALIGGTAVLAGTLLSRPREVIVLGRVGSGDMGAGGYPSSSSASDASSSSNYPSGSNPGEGNTSYPGGNQSYPGSGSPYKHELPPSPYVQPLRENCVAYHSLYAGDYVWLEPKYGKLVKAEFYENNEWHNYEESHISRGGRELPSWWFEHCRAASHDYRDLYESHMNAFVRDSRFAVMRYTFANGKVYQSDLHPDVFSDMFLLEEAYAMRLMEAKNCIAFNNHDSETFASLPPPYQFQ